MDSIGHMVHKPCTPNLSPLRGSLTIVFLSKSFDHKPVDCGNGQKRLLNQDSRIYREKNWNIKLVGTIYAKAHDGYKA